jgi:hypothetical protein
MYFTNKKVLAEGFKINSQTPFDDRLIFADLTDLQDLGTGNVNAFRYYEGMLVYVIDLNSIFVWKESITGALGTSFTYPSNIIANGVNYSGRDFNFVLISSGSSLISNITFTKVLTAFTPSNFTAELVANALTTAKFITIYDTFTGEDITKGLYIDLINNEITSNSDIASVTVNLIGQ